MPASKSSLGSFSPAVSIRRKLLSMRVMTLSRVVPSSRATIAIFWWAKRLSRLDLPALVWPISATIGRDFMLNIIPYNLVLCYNIWYMKGQKRIRGWFSRNWQYFVVVIFGLILSMGVWAFVQQVMTGDDYAFHVTRLQSALAGWQNGQIVPQVDPNALNGFGYAYNLFYGPLVTYIAGGLQLLISSWPIVINLILVLCLLGAGLTMCYAMTKISQNQALATLVAAFYMSAPYALNNLYSRMALGEVVAFVAAPILLLGLYRLLIRDKRAARCIAVSAALLLLSHSLSAMLFAIAAAIFVLLNWRKVFNWDNIWRMILGVAVALGLTAFFTLPLVEAKMSNLYGVFNPGYSDVYFGANARSMNDHRLKPQQLLATNFNATNAEGCRANSV